MNTFSRRALFGALGGTAAASTLAACRWGTPTAGPSGSATGTATASTVPTSAANPFGVPSGAGVQLMVDESRVGRGWADDLASQLGRAPRPLQVRVQASSQVSTDVASSLTTGTPPDLVVDSGPDLFGLGQAAAHLSPLDDVLRAYTTLADGREVTIEQALRPGTAVAGAAGGRHVALPYVHDVQGLWYSTKLFATHHWQAPATWEALAALAVETKAAGMHLFCWGRDSATSYLRLCLASAVKQAGEELRLAFEGLDEKAWSAAEVQSVLKAMKQLVDAGHVKPGGSQTTWRTAMKAWAQEGQVALAPAGSWLASMSGVSDSFGLALAPDPAVAASPALGATAVHAGPSVNLVVPARAGDVAGGKELLRLAFARNQALAFTATTHQLTTLADAVPTAPDARLAAQLRVLQRAGKATFHLGFIDSYGTNHDHQTLWNAFLEGTMDVATLTAESRAITRLVGADSSQARSTVR